MTEQAEANPTTHSEPWTIKRILEWSTSFLRDKGSSSPRLDAELLLCSTLSCRRIDLYTGFDKPLEAFERDRFKQFLRRRGAGEPVAYILGEKEFFGLSFKVTSDVLIPRPETEHLVETVLRDFKESADDLEILDLGTGSGCIAIALATNLQGSHVEAWDVSERALAVARENGERHGANVTWQIRDIKENEAWSQTGVFDCIVSNPPYISSSEKPDLAISVKDYEPHLALFADEAGLAFYRIISRQALSHLKRSGRLYLEIGFEQASSVSALLSEAGWEEIAVLKDLAGHPRLVTARAP